MEILLESELFWLVGLLEGEGYFGFEKWSQRVQLKMTDLDVIEKASSILSKVTGREHTIHESPNNVLGENMPYVVAVHGEDARKVMHLVVKHMSFRRKCRIWQSLNGYKPKNLKLDITKIIQLPVRTEIIAQPPMKLRRI